MKKYVFPVFLILLWGVAEAFNDPRRLIGVAAAAAALACVLLIRKPAVGLPVALGIAVGTAFLQPDFSFRLVPVLLLLAARDAVIRIGKGKKALGKKRDGVYTLMLFSVLTCIGVLVSDIVFSVRNPVRYAIGSFDWALFFTVLCTALLALYAYVYRTAVGKLLFFTYLFAFAAVSAGMVGYLLNSRNYDIYVFVFPWLVFLVSGKEDDPVTAGASERIVRLLRGR